MINLRTLKKVFSWVMIMSLLFNNVHAVLIFTDDVSDVSSSGGLGQQEVLSGEEQQEQEQEEVITETTIDVATSSGSDVIDSPDQEISDNTSSDTLLSGSNLSLSGSLEVGELDGLGTGEDTGIDSSGSIITTDISSGVGLGVSETGVVVIDTGSLGKSLDLGTGTIEAGDRENVDEGTGVVTETVVKKIAPDAVKERSSIEAAKIEGKIIEKDKAEDNIGTTDVIGENEADQDPDLMGLPNTCHPYYWYFDYNNDDDLDNDDIQLLQDLILGVTQGDPGQTLTEVCVDLYPGKDCNPNDSSDNNITTADLVYLQKIINGQTDEGDLLDDNIDNDCDGEVDNDCTCDSDSDNVCDFGNNGDNCPGYWNPGQEDENGYQDGTGEGDACEDVPVCYGQGGDEDGDGICGDEDNCPEVSNPGQEDEDGDGIGDACENITICDDTFVSPTLPETINIGDVDTTNDFFTITCEGENVSMFQVQGEDPNGEYIEMDMGGMGETEFLYGDDSDETLIEGEYTFYCVARGEGNMNDYIICPDTYGTVVSLCADTDNDGICDDEDLCPEDAWNTDTGAPENLGETCTVSNACGESNTGTIECDGLCNAVAPAIPEEICGDDIDNDCDGIVDEGCPTCDTVVDPDTIGVCNEDEFIITCTGGNIQADAILVYQGNYGLTNAGMNGVFLFDIIQLNGTNTATYQPGEPGVYSFVCVDVLGNNSLNTLTFTANFGNTSQYEMCYPATGVVEGDALSCDQDIDPAVEIIDNNQYCGNNDYMCGENIVEKVIISNTNAAAVTAEGLETKIGVDHGEIVSWDTEDDTDCSFADTAHTEITCKTDSLDVGESSNIFVHVLLDDCSCGDSYDFTISSSISAEGPLGAVDIDGTNNQDSVLYAVSSNDNNCDLCESTSIDPDTITAYDNEVFTITCEGTNVDYFTVNVYNENGDLVDTSDDLVDNDDNDSETWQYNQDTVGTYTFECVAYQVNVCGNATSDTCNTVEGTVLPLPSVPNLYIYKNGNYDTVNDVIVYDFNYNITEGDAIYPVITDGVPGGVCLQDINFDGVGTVEVSYDDRETRTSFNGEDCGITDFRYILPYGDAGVSGIGSVSFVIRDTSMDEVCNTVLFSADNAQYEYSTSCVDIPQTTCDDTSLDPTSVEVNGDVFTITCEGTNANMYKVKVEKPNGDIEWVDIPNNQNWVEYDPELVGTYEFTCSAWGEYGDDFCDTETGTVYEDNYDLALEKTLLTNEIVEPGDIVTFEITVINEGDIAAENIDVVDYMIDGLQYNSSSLPAWLNGNNGTQRVVHIPGTLLPGESTSFTITFTVSSTVSDEDVLVNWAEISQDNGNDIDSVPYNQSNDEDDDDNAFVTVNISSVSNLSIYKNGIYNDNTNKLVYTINYAITEADATYPVVTDTVPAGTCLDDVYFNDGVLEVSYDNRVTWTDFNGGNCNITDFRLVLAYGDEGVTGALTALFSVSDASADEVCNTVLFSADNAQYEYSTSCVDIPQTTCDDTALDPTSVEVNGDVFTITCEGTNADMYKVKVEKPNGDIEWVDVPNNQNRVEYDPELVGTYAFTCSAWGAYGDDFCDTETGTVYEDLITTCNETEVTPETVTVDDEAFVVTCDGSNVDQYTVEITLPDGSIVEKVLDNGVSTLSYLPHEVGYYHFQCVAIGYNTDTCSMDYGYANPHLVDPLIDPAIDIESANGNNYTCGETIYYYTTLSNTNAATEDASFTATIDVPLGSNIDASSITLLGVDDGEYVDCSLSSLNTMVCDAKLASAHEVKIWFAVDLEDCDCDDAYWFNIEGTILNTPADVNHINNYDNEHVKITSDVTCNECTAPLGDNAVTIDNFSDGDIVYTDTVTVYGQIYDTDVEKITLNGEDVAIVSNTYSGTIDVHMGDNIITVVAYSSDDDCLPITKHVTIYRDTLVCDDPITLVVNQPLDGFVTRDHTIIVSGTVSSGAIVKVNGVVVAGDDDGTWSEDVTLNAGTQDIVVTAENDDDNCDVTKTITVTRKTGGGHTSSVGGNNYCGDGIARHGEECDDGNAVNGDGCNSRCEIEPLLPVGPDKEIEDIIKKKKFVTILEKRKIKVEPFEFQAPKILAKTGMFGNTPTQKIGGNFLMNFLEAEDVKRKEDDEL